VSALLKAAEAPAFASVPTLAWLHSEPASAEALAPTDMPDAADELSDEDLEHVVGGLMRAWAPMEEGSAMAGVHFGVLIGPTVTPVRGESGL
jgi:hypothetical protein